MKVDYQRWLGDRLVARPSIAPHPNQIVFDSRLVDRGQWLFALAREQVAEHITEAIERGASGFFASIKHRRQLSSQLAQQGIWLASEPIEALTAIARGYRAQLTAKIIAITGSSGKTTVKELLADTLSYQFPVCRSLANRNNEIGVPQTILSITEQDRYAILELGARQIGDLKFLTELVCPDVALCTNIGTAHLGIFGSADNLLQAKCEIFRYAPDHCRAIVNADYPALVQMSKESGRRLLTFAAQHNAEVTVTSKISDGNQAIVIRRNDSSKFEVVSTKPHTTLPINIAAVVAVCQALDVDCQAPLLQTVLDSWQNVAGRFEKITTADGLLIIDDSYNANPDSMRCGLASLELAYPKQKKVLVLGDMLELGDSAIQQHQSLTDTISALNPALLITVGSLAHHIGENSNLTTMSFADVQSLIEAQIDFASYGEIVYLKASNGIALSKLAESLRV